MDFSLDKKHEMARTLFREFAEKEVKPLAVEVDETEIFPRETVNKMAKYGFLELNENLTSLTPTSNLKVRDCINLFYNMLKTNMKDGGAYIATVFGGELNSDKEVNPLKLADNSLKGPKVVKSVNQLIQAVPFDYKDANLFVDGSSVGADRFKSLMVSSDVGLVIYYSAAAKTIWAYDENTDATNGKKAVHGTVESIYYESTSTLTPTSVTIDIQNCKQRYAICILYLRKYQG